MISAILLAAGESKRMNGRNKLIEKVNGEPLIKHSVRNILESSIDELIIIVGHHSKIIKNLINKNKKIKFIFNSNYKSGIASSIKLGLKNLSEQTQGFFICLGDMPMINKEIYNKLIMHLKNNEIVVPTFKNKQGNPILFSNLMKDKVMMVEGDNGAKKILELHKDKIFNVDIKDLKILKDFDTQDDFSN